VRKQQAEGGVFALLALAKDLATKTFHHTLAEAKADAGALARGRSGEEKVEDSSTIAF